MIAYKGFEKNLSCRGYQFKRYGINETTEANCRQNGFHCAENPLDCLVHYPNWRNSRYFVVKAFGDLDEDDRDTKISCTKIELIKELDFPTLLLRGAAYMAIHPDRPWCSLVCKETGVGNNGFVIVRGKQPKAKGRKNDLLILVQEEPDSNEIIYVNPVWQTGEWMRTKLTRMLCRIHIPLVPQEFISGNDCFLILLMRAKTLWT